MRVVAAITVACALGVPLHCGATEEALGAEAARSIVMVDGHFHVMPWMEPRELLDHMDRNAIRWAGGAGAPGGPERNEAVAAALGNRYIRSSGGGDWFGLMRGGATSLEKADTPEFQAMLRRVEFGLRDRGARVIGEVVVNNLDSGGPNVPSIKTRANSATLKALLDMAARYKRPLMLHAQWDRDTAAEFRELAASNRGARLVLAHCGSDASAADIRELFEGNPNVACDLSARNGAQLKGRYLARAIFSRNGVRGDWRKLIEEFPDRFIVGIDHAGSWDEYDSAVQSIRGGLLAHLSRDAAEKVAHANAQAWFDLSD